MRDLPRAEIPWVPAELGRVPWPDLPPLAELVRAADGGRPEQPTWVRAGHDGTTLFVRFDCVDRDAWGTFRRRDDPIYEEEAVEVFLAPGAADPVRYFELEVSPLGVLFDAIIENPTSRRAEMTIDTSWDCPGLRWEAGRGAARRPIGSAGDRGGAFATDAEGPQKAWTADRPTGSAGDRGGAFTGHAEGPQKAWTAGRPTGSAGDRGGAFATDAEGPQEVSTAGQDWWAALAIPWSALAPPAAAGEEALPAVWRGNFYRIERPRGGAAELSAWSPTLNRPLDFHLPARFGVLTAHAARSTA
jgi:hypothetical protein